MVKRAVTGIFLLLALTSLLATEKEPLTEYRARRARLAERIKGNVLVLRAAPEEELVEYQQEDNFYYLTGFDEPDAILLLDAASSTPQEFFFIPERKPSEERWTGKKLGPGPDAARAIGMAKVLPMPEFDSTLKVVSERAKAVYGLKEAAKDIAYLRQIKSGTEIALLEKAIQITLKAHQAAARTVAPGAMEYEVEAALEYEFRRNGAERPGFPSIVGSGPFSTILHYDKSTRRMDPGDVVVVDIGAEYGGYSADVTRTYPVSGKFSKRQREVYQIVLDAQKAAIARVKPGATIGRFIRQLWPTSGRKVTRSPSSTERVTTSASTFTTQGQRLAPSSRTWSSQLNRASIFQKRNWASVLKMTCSSRRADIGFFLHFQRKSMKSRTWFKRAGNRGLPVLLRLGYNSRFH